MKWILLVIEDSLIVKVLDKEPTGKFFENGRMFIETTVDGNPVFYDYYRDPSDSVVGIEIHATADDAGFHGLFDNPIASPYIDFSPFPIIWFTDHVGAVPMGIEGFGDLKTFKSENGITAIAVCPENWISTSRLRFNGMQETT
jgi:hypothetical protein